MTTLSVSKALSKNDAGVGSSKEHGILIPKHPDFQSFFPQLDTTMTNPKTTFQCEDQSDGTLYDLNYTYYNNTKNEYRLTRANKFLKQRGAVEGSVLKISRKANGRYYIDLIPEGEFAPPEPTSNRQAPTSALPDSAPNNPPSSKDITGNQEDSMGGGWLRKFVNTWSIVTSEG